MDIPDQSTSVCDDCSLQVLHSLPESEPSYDLPFTLLSGERVVHYGHSVDGIVVLTRYRLYLQVGEQQYHIPLGLIEVVEHRELFYLHIGCKDARTFRCTFENNDSALEWYSRISKAIEPPKMLNQLFAFVHYQAFMKQKIDDHFQNTRNCLFDKKLFKSEMARLQFSGDSWRISEVNANYKLCPTYPPYLLVPSCITDETLESVAKFRSSRRIPAVVWRHVGNGAVIARCSQPEVGWLWWRSNEDEDLIKAISDACNFHWNHKNGDNCSNLSHSPNSRHSTECLHITSEMTQDKKVLIMDARSYTTAVANRARGGGCECPEYYPNCEIQFMNLANIHTIRKSFHALRQLCMSSADQPNWFSQLEGTRWLLHMSTLMKAAVTLVTAIERDARPVLVHCSDGWDRTPQIVALAELLLDPYYRTMDGFRILIEREWLAFGHKFSDRCGHTTGSEDINERCPVFLQWLDCVHQVHQQFSCAFEFSHTYLVKLAQHTYSNLFGTFLCNTQQERKVKMVYSSTFSVWDFLNSPRFKNHLYNPTSSVCSSRVLWPQCNVRDLNVWTEVYLGSLEANSSTEGASGSCPGPPRASPHHMTKTRSYGDLINTAENGPGHVRRSSDPSINIDKKLPVLLKAGKPQDSSHMPQEPLPCLPAQETNGNMIQNGREDFLYSGKGGGPEENGCTGDFFSDDCRLLNGRTTKNKDISNGDLARVHVNGTVSHSHHNQQCVDIDGSTIKFLRHNIVINGDKTDDNDCEIDVRNKDLGSICVDDVAAVVDNGLRLNGNDNAAVVDCMDELDSQCTTPEKSESKSENTVCDIGAYLGIKSVETSTDTLVSDNNLGSSFKEANGFEKLNTPVESLDNALIFEFDNDRSKSPVPPPTRSRTSSSSDWDNCMHTVAKPSQMMYNYPLGDDGLMPLKSAVQERLQEIIDEHRRREEMLQKELHIYRLKLAKQVCHKCNYNEAEKLDDNSDSENESSKRSLAHSLSCSPQRISSPIYKRVSVVESVCSAGEGPTSAVESLRSDMSWEALEETSPFSECQGALWVPDYAVSRCMGCDTKFWLGRRKHHCRKCGRIFCADCSENSTPLPSEQLYNPVRVCTSCYSKLRRDCGEVPEQCKHFHQTQAANNNPQIAASSN